VTADPSPPSPTADPAHPRRLLFLCTGNYYRSRFAEILFNHYADRRDLGWRADSRGLMVDRSNGNVGPISADALWALALRGIACPTTRRPGRQVSEAELAGATRVIALHEAEHRPMMRHRFAAWVDRVDYWDVADMPLRTPAEALADIERRVTRLVTALA
jgi:protein-tyrosine phosphatase